MEPIIAKCGYRCDLCLIHEANLKGEEDKRRMSEALAKYYECDVPLEKVRPCKGCADAQDPPDVNCQVFPCVRERGIENCGHCPDFGCEKLKTRMDVVEQCLGKHPDVPEGDHSLFFRPYLSRTVLTEIHKSLRM